MALTKVGKEGITGISNSSDATAITIDSSENVGVGVSPTTSYGKSLQIHDTGTSGANLRLTDSNTGSGTGNGFELITINTESYLINREAGPINTIINGDTVHKIDANGHVTKPKQPAFQAKNDGTQSDIATSTQVAVAFGTERFDVNADFASNTFTAPVTGKYQLNVIMRLDSLDSAADYYELKLVTSNNNYGILTDPDFGQDNSYWDMTISVLTDMDASDTATVQIRQQSGTAQADITSIYFSGFLAC